MKIKIYQVKCSPIPGTSYREIYQKALANYKLLKRNPRRRPYLRSAYFKKDKIFLQLFWNHLHEKLNHRDKTRRVKYFPCALELIKNTKFDPESKENVDRKSEILHRFAGKTSEGVIFFVQIKEEKRTGQKWLVSVFPVDKQI